VGAGDFTESHADERVYEESNIINKLWKKILWEDQGERNLHFSILWAFGFKGLALVVYLFSMPLYIKYFHDQIDPNGGKINVTVSE